jgi:hypothetical protein
MAAPPSPTGKQLPSAPQPNADINFEREVPSLIETISSFISKVPYLNKALEMKDMFTQKIGIGNVITTQAIPHPEKYCIACHPFRDAVAVSRPGGRHLQRAVYLAWNKQDDLKTLPNTRHQVGVYCLTWSPINDYLYVGTSGGVCCWRMSVQPGLAGGAAQVRETMSYFYKHPKDMDVHCLQFSPSGRIFATTTEGERVVYVWDTATKVANALWCLEGGLGAGHLTWAPSGMHFCVSARDSDWRTRETTNSAVVMVEADTWYPWSWVTPKANAEAESKVGALAWIDRSHCIYTEYQSPLQLFMVSMDSTTPNARPRSIMPAPVIIDLAWRDVYGRSLEDYNYSDECRDAWMKSIKIDVLVTEPVTKCFAVSFLRRDTPQAFIGIYMAVTQPTFTLRLVSALQTRGGPVQAMAFRPPKVTTGVLSPVTELSLLVVSDGGCIGPKLYEYPIQIRTP